MIARFIFLLLGVVGFAEKKSKFIGSILFLFIFISFGWNYDNPDYDNYLQKYELNNDSIFASGEIGYNFLCYLANQLHLTFQQFRIIIGFFCFALLFNIIRHVSRYPNLVIAIYLFFFFFIDVTQIRNFLSFVIVLYAFYKFLYFGTTSINIIKYCLLLIVATSIHFSSAFFLVFVLALRRIELKHVLIVTAIAGFIETVIYIFLENYLGKLVLYNEDRITMFAAVCFSLVQVLNYYAVKYVSATNSKYMKNSGNSKNKITAERMDIIVRCNMLLICLIPFYLDGSVFTRIFRYMAIINVIYLCNVIPTRFNQKYLLVLLVYVAYFAVMFNGLGLNSELANSVFDFNSFPNIK